MSPDTTRISASTKEISHNAFFGKAGSGTIQNCSATRRVSRMDDALLRGKEVLALLLRLNHLLIVSPYARKLGQDILHLILQFLVLCFQINDSLVIPVTIPRPVGQLILCGDFALVVIVEVAAPATG